MTPEIPANSPSLPTLLTIHHHIRPDSQPHKECICTRFSSSWLHLVFILFVCTPTWFSSRPRVALLLECLDGLSIDRLDYRVGGPLVSCIVFRFIFCRYTIINRVLLRAASRRINICDWECERLNSSLCENWCAYHGDSERSNEGQGPNWRTKPR